MKVGLIPDLNFDRGKSSSGPEKGAVFLFFSPTPFLRKEVFGTIK